MAGPMSNTTLTDHWTPLSIELNKTTTGADLTNSLIPDQYQIILLSVAYGVITLLSLIGNSSIIFIVLSNPSMRSVTNYFICNVALADCLVACLAVPFQFQAAVLQKWILPGFLCKLAPFVQTLCVDVSIYTLVIVSLDRYHVMLYPLKPKLSAHAAFLIFICVWLVSLVSSSPNLVLYNVYSLPNFGQQCLPYEHNKMERSNLTRTNQSKYDTHQLYIVFNIYYQYIIPCLIIFYSYLRIGSRLYFAKSVAQNESQQVIERNKRKVVKTLFIVIFLFLICWFPLQLYNFLNVYKPEINDYQHIVVVWLCANWLAMSNSCHNPFIYGFFSANFSREFRKIYSFLPCFGSFRREDSQRKRACDVLPKQDEKKKCVNSVHDLSNNAPYEYFGENLEHKAAIDHPRY